MEPAKTVKIISIVIIVITAWSLISGFLALISLIFSPETFTGFGYNRTYLMVAASIGLIGNLFLLIGAIKMLKHKESGRKITIYMLIIGLIVTLGNLVFSILSDQPFTYWSLLAFSFIISVVVNILVVRYLSKPKVKQFFIN